jgi:hypothetical protein
MPVVGGGPPHTMSDVTGIPGALIGWKTVRLDDFCNYASLHLA